MRVEVKVPQLPESVAEATLVSWHKSVGAAVARDENLVDVETDKVVLELPAPQAGVIVEILKGDGSTVGGGELVAIIDSEAVATVGATAAAAVPAAAASRASAALPASAAPPAGAASAVGAASSAAGASAAAALPAARKMMAEQGLGAADFAG